MSWPLKSFDIDGCTWFTWQLDRDTKAVIDFVLHVEEYSIIPHRKRSPLALQQHGYADLGICLQQSGDAIPLATYSLMHGCEIGLSDLKYVADFLLQNNGSPALKAKASFNDCIFAIADGLKLSTDERREFLEASLKQTPEPQPKWAVDPIIETLFAQLPEGCKQEFGDMDKDLPPT